MVGLLCTFLLNVGVFCFIFPCPLKFYLAGFLWLNTQALEFHFSWDLFQSRCGKPALWYQFLHTAIVLWNFLIVLTVMSRSLSSPMYFFREPHSPLWRSATPHQQPQDSSWICWLERKAILCGSADTGFYPSVYGTETFLLTVIPDCYVAISSQLYQLSEPRRGILGWAQYGWGLVYLVQILHLPAFSLSGWFTTISVMLSVKLACSTLLLIGLLDWAWTSNSVAQLVLLSSYVAHLAPSEDPEFRGARPHPPVGLCMSLWSPCSWALHLSFIWDPLPPCLTDGGRVLHGDHLPLLNPGLSDSW